MSRLTPQHYRVLVKVFKNIGFVKIRETGDHIVLERPDCRRPIIIPKYTEVGIDIIKSNLRTAGVSREEYIRILKKV